MRRVHAEGLRERQNQRNAGVSGRSDYVWVCRHCGAYHGEERHFGDCPECDQTPGHKWSSTMTFPEDLTDEQRRQHEAEQ